MSPMTKEELQKIKDEITSRAKKTWIRVGMATCGIAAGAQDTFFALREELRKQKLTVEVKKCGCVGKCSQEPLVEVAVEGMPTVMYRNLMRDQVAELIQTHLVNKQVMKSHVLEAHDDKQMRIVLRNCGLVDPESLRDYVSYDGYFSIAKILAQMTPEQVIAEIKESGLRGRGGAGFPTGIKWDLTRKVTADQKYVICNGDEGDPGAYMDRGVLEGDPHSVIEGMMIAGYAIGATKGYFYIRAEYPLAVERIEKAIKACHANGLLGTNILGSSFSFDLEVRLGAGAFVCGEETALIASIEGKRGYPHPRPPYPAVKGLWDKPTCINNVETLANLPPIILKGAKWFSAIGHERSKGTKVFAVTGKVKHSGLVEVPMGTTIRDIVFGIAGGPMDGKTIKAVQTGGPSGGVIPKEHFDTPVSYENFQKLGSIMGSGGMIVMDEDDSMVDITKFYLGFCVDESCGKCAPCRIGGTQMLRILDRITAGKGVSADLDKLRKISQAMQKASLCGLGQTAPNPVLSTLRYFENEYRALIQEAQAAGV